MSITHHYPGMSRTHDRTRTGKHRIVGLLDLLRRWQARIRQRRDLEQLDLRLLEDVGLTAQQRARELRKPFWKS